jgi:DUF1680 family protein
MKAFSLDRVRLLPGLFADRFALNRRYLMSLSSESLLQNHLLEAGLWQARLGETKRNRNHDPQQLAEDGSTIHLGWESPSCQLRGHFLGHWMSAAARICAATGDAEVKAKLNAIVSDLARCQQANGGEWVASIPPAYLDRIARGQQIWAPHYTIHKTLMGLFDAFAYAANEQALVVLDRAAHWFTRWTDRFSREEMDEILDVETGGMLEVWADLYGATGKAEHLELVRRYTRDRLFEPLLDGKDVLTNRHANTTIPEIHGAARAFDVTGEDRWLRIVEAYWKAAVTDRGFFCTGGQTSGEIWTPPSRFAARLGDTNQEHCVVYNMMRLADWLFRKNGDVAYGDYVERNLYNGILAQQNPSTGMIAYFLPLEPGARKIWGSPRTDFWCCHGTLLQAHTAHNAYVYYEDDKTLVVAQYIPSEVAWEANGSKVVVRQTPVEMDRRDTIKRPYVITPEDWHRSRCWRIRIDIEADKPVELELRLRLPWWLAGDPRVVVDGEATPAEGTEGFVILRRRWKHNTVHIELPKRLAACPLPDRTDTVAFMDGPAVLAGLVDGEQTLIGDVDDPDSLLTPDNEKEWGNWLPGYKTVGQARNIRFQPLYTVVDEPYTVYFPVRES